MVTIKTNTREYKVQGNKFYDVVEDCFVTYLDIIHWLEDEMEYELIKRIDAKIHPYPSVILTVRSGDFKCKLYSDVVHRLLSSAKTAYQFSFEQNFLLLLDWNKNLFLK